MKEKYDHRLLLKHLPSDLRVFLEHIQVISNIIYTNYMTIKSIFVLIHLYFCRVWNMQINQIMVCYLVCLIDV